MKQDDLGSGSSKKAQNLRYQIAGRAELTGKTGARCRAASSPSTSSTGANRMKIRDSLQKWTTGAWIGLLGMTGKAERNAVLKTRLLKWMLTSSVWLPDFCHIVLLHLPSRIWMLLFSQKQAATPSLTKEKEKSPIDNDTPYDEKLTQVWSVYNDA